MYDQFGFYSDQGMPGAGGEGGPLPGGPNMGFGGFDFSEFARKGGGAGGAGAGAADEDGFGFRRLVRAVLRRRARAQQSQAPQRGADLEYALNVDFWQAIKGTQVRLNINRQELCDTCKGTGSAGGNTPVCPECNGSGQVDQMAGAMRFNLTCPRCGGKGRLQNTCPTCYGDGRVSRTDSVEVRIPAGVQSGSRLRVAGKGNAGTHGAPAGDLYITVRVDPHAILRAGRRQYRNQSACDGHRGRSRGQDRSADHRRTRAVEDSPRHAERPEVPAARKRRLQLRRKNTRGDQIVEVVLQAPKVQDERTKELLAGTRAGAT